MRGRKKENKKKEERDMKNDVEKMVEIVEDKAALETGLRVILWAAEKRELPDEGLLPVFNDSMTEELFREVLEKVAGKEY